MPFQRLAPIVSFGEVRGVRKGEGEGRGEGGEKRQGREVYVDVARYGVLS